MQRNDNQGKKTKKRKTMRDGAYNPRNPQNKRRKKTPDEDTSANTLRMRTDNSTTFTAEDGTNIPVKTTALLNINKQPLYYSSENRTLLMQRFESISSHRPAYEITDFSMNGSPLKVTTPGKTTLHRTLTLGNLSHFSNHLGLVIQPDFTTQTALGSTVDFENTPQFEGLKKVVKSYKLQNENITSALLDATKKQYIKDNYRRPSSQQAAMSETSKTRSKEYGATRYAEATELFSENMRWEWLHMIAYMILGHKSQDVDNLVGGTFHANTNMMFIEHEMSYLTEQYPEGFKLSVKANLIPNTHIATQIEYTITTSDFSHTLTFDAQHPVKPHISVKDYVHADLQTKVEMSKKEKENKTEMPSTPKSVSLPFFQKRALAESKEHPATIKKSFGPTKKPGK